MSEGYHSISSNGSEGLNRRLKLPLGAIIKERPKQSNLRSTFVPVPRDDDDDDDAPSTSTFSSDEPDHVSEENPRGVERRNVTRRGVTPIDRAPPEPAMFRARAKSNSDSLGAKVDEASTKMTKMASEMNLNRWEDGATSESRVPKAAVLPRSASQFNVGPRLGITRPIRQQSPSSACRPPASSQQPVPYEALPSYPYSFQPHDPARLPTDVHYPPAACYSCGALTAPRFDEGGVFQPACMACLGGPMTKQAVAPLTVTAPPSPSKNRRSWHDGDAAAFLAANYPPRPTTGASDPYPAYYPYPFSESYSSSRPAYVPSSQPPPKPPSPSTSSASADRDATRWDSLRRVADSMIKEKDIVIEKQRQQIQQLESLARQQQQEQLTSDAATRRTGAAQSGKQFRQRPFDPVLFHQQTKELEVKMQEFQYETAAVRAQLAEASATSKMEADDLARRLTETELQLERNKRDFVDELQRKESGLAEAAARLEDRDKVYDELRHKCRVKEKELARTKKQLSNIETYLADLPTPQEVAENESRAALLEERLAKAVARADAAEEEAAAMRADAEAKAAVIESLEQGEEEWKVKLESSDRERVKYREMIRALKIGSGVSGGDSDSGVNVEDMEDEIHRLRADGDRLRKLLEAQQKRQKTQQREAKIREEDLVDQTRRLHERVTTLEQTVKSRDAEAERFRGRIDDDDAIKESLRQRLAQLTEDLAELKSDGEDAALREKMQQRVAAELAECLAELQGLVQICTDEAEGKDPNMSVLLGLRREDATHAKVPERSNFQAEADKDPATCLARVKAVRRDVDKLRTLLSNKIADEMGDNLDCTQQ